MRYDKANWENIKIDLNDTMRTIKDKYMYISCEVNELWNILVCPLFVDLSIIVEITIKSTNKIKYGIALSISKPKA